MSDELPVIAKRGAYVLLAEAGKSYWWCACGLSKTQPFCDGSHKGSGMAPVEFIAEEDDMVAFCGCKRTASAPCCDGTHGTL